MSRNCLCAALALLLLLAGCADPPGYRGAYLGMMTEELLSARPLLREVAEGWSSDLAVFESGPSGDVRNEYYLVKDGLLAVIIVLHDREAGFLEIQERFVAERGRPNRRLQLYGRPMVSWQTWRGNTHLLKTGRAGRRALKLPLGQEIQVEGEQVVAIISAED